MLCWVYYFMLFLFFLLFFTGQIYTTFLNYVYICPEKIQKKYDIFCFCQKNGRKIAFFAQ